MMMESRIMKRVMSCICAYGLWANAPLDDSQLPADFVVDWCRVWQRDDLK